MAAAVAGMLSKKVLKETAENRFGHEDPYFETVPATNLLGRPTMKKRRKAAPDGISKNDAKVLTKVKRRAYRLDLCLFSLCGIKFGWGSVIGLVPAIGDVLDLFLALMVVMSCNKIDGKLPTGIRLRMLFNVAIDFFIGLIPIVGDLADAIYKCNTRNAVLLEKFLKERGEKNLQNSEKQNSDPENNGRIREAEEERGRHHQQRGGSNNNSPPRQPMPSRPQPARVDSGRQGSRNGYPGDHHMPPTRPQPTRVDSGRQGSRNGHPGDQRVPSRPQPTRLDSGRQGSRDGQRPGNHHMPSTRSQPAQWDSGRQASRNGRSGRRREPDMEMGVI
ncbi:hypothetical protein AJ80_03917 [Polytolypa hystricis UAMH7299]|uniref:PH domain-containing protein n=1 Tax=Polytolypa hystricis (strain UAMH7299) TaxID=1447883 RepID=A0A2B7YFN5_POLH7|nr:hypothetical protein AJ80_03917 [Polytolypa hystricis UAMH7299]